MNAMQGHGIDECRGGEADSLAGMSRGPGSMPQYLERALEEASSDAGRCSRRAWVSERTYEWFLAWMIDRFRMGVDVDPTEAGEAWSDFNHMANKEYAVDGVPL